MHHVSSGLSAREAWSTKSTLQSSGLKLSCVLWKLLGAQYCAQLRKLGLSPTGPVPRRAMRIYGPMVISSVHSAQKSQVKSERYLGLGPFIMQPGWLWFTLLVYNIFHLIIYCKFYQEGLHTVSNEIFVKIILSHSPTKTVASNYQIHFLGPKKIGAGFLIFDAVTVPTLILVIKLPC